MSVETEMIPGTSTSSVSLLGLILKTACSVAWTICFSILLLSPFLQWHSPLAKLHRSLSPVSQLPPGVFSISSSRMWSRFPLSTTGCILTEFYNIYLYSSLFLPVVWMHLANKPCLTHLCITIVPNMLSMWLDLNSIDWLDMNLQKPLQMVFSFSVFVPRKDTSYLLSCFSEPWEP